MLQPQGCFFKILKFLVKAQSNSLRCSASLRVRSRDAASHVRTMRFFNSKVRPSALGIGAASFWSAAEKDIAESPTAEPERPKKEDYKSTRLHDYKLLG